MGLTPAVPLFTFGNYGRRAPPCDQCDQGRVGAFGGVEWVPVERGAKPVIQVGIVNNRDTTADKLRASLQARGIDAAVELFALPSIPRGASGKVNRVQLKSALEQAQPLTFGR